MTTKKITKADIKNTENYFNTSGFYNRFRRMAKFVIPFQKDITFHLNVGGGSFTDGNSITIGLFEFMVNRSREEQFLALKALVGHEAEHVVSSDFVVFVDFQDRVNEFFQSNYGIKGGMRVGANMLNAVEDGRIEKRLVNRLKGMKKNIQFLRSVLWEEQPNKKENELMEYILNVCSIATSGIFMKDFDKMYGGTRMETEINKVKPLIIKAINEPTAKGCADRVFEIIEENADFIADLMETQEMKELDSTPEYTTSPKKGSDKEDVGNSESSHFKPEEENSEESKGSEGSEKKEDSEDSDTSGESGVSEESEQDSKNDKDSTKDGEGNGGSSEEGEDGKAMASDSTKPSKDNSASEIEGESEASTPSNEEYDEGDDAGESSEKGLTDKELIRIAMRESKKELATEADSDIKQSHREDKIMKIEDAKMAASEAKIAPTAAEIKSILGNNDSKVKAAGYQLQNDQKTYRTLSPELKQKGFKFRKDVEKIFKNKEGFNLKNKRNGILDPNALWRMTAGDTDIFNRKGNPIETDFAVSVLVDNSGSMSGAEHGKRKMDSAIEACIIMEEGLKGTLPLAITRFDEVDDVVNHERIRTFDDNSKENESNKVSRYTGMGNLDGFSIMIAAAELEKRPEKEKLLLVLSDGEPAYREGIKSGINHVKTAVSDARKKGIKVIAIRFGNPGHLARTAGYYKEMYDHSFISCESKDIQKELVKQLKKTLK